MMSNLKQQIFIEINKFIIPSMVGSIPLMIFMGNRFLTLNEKNRR